MNTKKISISYQQRLQHRGLHSPAEINLLGSLGDIIISISIRANSDPINGYALRRIISSGVPSPV